MFKDIQFIPSSVKNSVSYHLILARFETANILEVILLDQISGKFLFE